MKWHEFAEKFPIIGGGEGEEWEAFKASIRDTGGNEEPVIYRMIDGPNGPQEQGLDGQNRQLACSQLKIKCLKKEVSVADGDVREFIIRRNVRRRHLTGEQRQAIVAALSADGKSTRQIAEILGVSQPTVLRDLESADSTKQGKKSSTDTNVSPGVVVGKDGKIRPRKAVKSSILCSRCQRIGSPVKGCAACKETRKEAAKEAKKPKPPPAAAEREPGDDTESEKADALVPALLDAEGTPVPAQALAAFELAGKIEEWGREMDAMIRCMKEFTEHNGGRLVDYETVRTHLKNGKMAVLQNRATHVCPLCSGFQDGRKKCECCKGHGWTAAHVYLRLKKEMEK